MRFFRSCQIKVFHEAKRHTHDTLARKKNLTFQLGIFTHILSLGEENQVFLSTLEYFVFDSCKIQHHIAPSYFINVLLNGSRSSSHHYFDCSWHFSCHSAYLFLWPNHMDLLQSITEITQKHCNSKPSPGHALFAWTAAKKINKNPTSHSGKQFNIRCVK